MDELSSDLQRKPGPVVFLRYRSVCLKLRLFANPKARTELTTRVCSSKRLVRGKSEIFVSLYHEVPTTGGLLDAFRLLVLG